MCVCVGGGGGGRMGGTETKTVCQTVQCSNDVNYKKNNNLHNVEHVVESTFRNILINFKTNPKTLI